MTKLRTLALVVVFLNLVNCSSDKHKFPIDKRYWDTQDYADVIRTLSYGYDSDEKLPTLNDPETRVIVEKLTDTQNYIVVLNDQELGLKYKNEVATKFFTRWKDMQNIYLAIDRKDQYIYDQEMIAVWQFGLDLQLHYFKLGNDQILEGADDPNSTRVKNAINSNINTLINNYIIYLDLINEENALSVEGKNKFSQGIDKHFTALVELYPKANYSALEKKD